MPSPLPSISQRLRCAEEPVVRRGYHRTGTEMVRPSVRWTMSSSSVTRTSRARAMEVLTEVLMPYLQKTEPVVHEDGFYLPELVRGKVGGIREREGLEPELSELAIAPNMNMRRLVTLVAVEEEAVRADTKDGGQVVSLGLGV